MGSRRGVCESGGEDFFIISGYLITTLLLKEWERSSTIGLREFYIRRAYRILPAAIAFMAPVFVIYWGQLRWYHMAAALYVTNFDPLASVVFGALVVAECRGAILFFVAGSAEEVASASDCDPGRGDRVCSDLSGCVPLAEIAWASGRDVSGGGGRAGDGVFAGDFCGAAASDQDALGGGDDGASGSGSGVRGRGTLSHDGVTSAGVLAGAARFHFFAAVACGAESLLDIER